MTEKTAADRTTKAPTRKAASSENTTRSGFTAEERAAMKERAKELRAEAKGAKNREKGEADVQAKIAEMPAGDRAIAAAIHRIVAEQAPELTPRTWYGMPAYADANGKTVVFFKAASKFDVRYGELGFNEDAMLDDGTMWPTVYAITELNAVNETLVAKLVRKAVVG